LKITPRSSKDEVILSLSVEWADQQETEIEDLRRLKVKFIQR